MWYPPVDAAEPSQWYALGRKVCSTCDSWEACLSTAENDNHGMWGGLTPLERRRQSKVHGHWVDYRRGCRCASCSKAHRKQMTEVPVDLSLLPGAYDPPPDNLAGFLFSLV